MEATKYIFSRIFVSCIFLFYSLSFQGQTYKGKKIENAGRRSSIAALQPLADSLYRSFFYQHKLPALVYAIVADGEIIFEGKLGAQDLSSRKNADQQSVFRIASMTKSFTAMAILQLRDEGRLSLDDHAMNYVPEMKGWKSFPGHDSISIWNLLTHSSGLPEDNPWGDRQLARTEAELSQMLLAEPALANPPGAGFEYSNLGYAILGRIITNVSGMPYQEFISNRIFKPLGMHNTYWDPSSVPPQLLVQGYRLLNGKYEKEPLLPDGSFGAMGGLLTNLQDFSAYTHFHMNALQNENPVADSVLKQSSLMEMQRPHAVSGMNANFRFASGRTCAFASGYGFGLRWMKDCQNKTYLGHSGGLPGFGSNWTFLPEYGVGVVAFANLTYTPLGNFHISLLDTLIKRSGIKMPAVDGAAILEQRKKELLSFLPTWSKAATSDIFAENFFKDFPIEQLKNTTAPVFDKIGDVKATGPMQPVNRLRGSFIIEGAKANAEVFFTLSPENPAKIQYFRIRLIQQN